jgi:hypothetical protein
MYTVYFQRDVSAVSGNYQGTPRREGENITVS